MPLQAYVHKAGNIKKILKYKKRIEIKSKLEFYKYYVQHRTYINKTTQIKYTPAEIKLNAPGNVFNVFAYTKLYRGADPNGDIDSIDVVSE